MQYIDLNLLDNDLRNPNVCHPTTKGKIRNNIKRYNRVEPFIIRPNPDVSGRWIIVNGHVRKQILLELGWEKAPCIIWEMTDTEAQLALATLNELRGRPVPKKRRELIFSLLTVIPEAELLELIPETEDELKDIQAMMDADFEALEQALDAEIACEVAELPVSYTFLISAKDQPVLDAALKAFSDGQSDRSHALIRICTRVMEGQHAEKERS